jgi:hypothetical protein
MMIGLLDRDAASSMPTNTMVMEAKMADRKSVV